MKNGLCEELFKAEVHVGYLGAQMTIHGQKLFVFIAEYGGHKILIILHTLIIFSGFFNVFAINYKQFVINN